jgi:hypothetical protein
MLFMFGVAQISRKKGLMVRAYRTIIAMARIAITVFGAMSNQRRRAARQSRAELPAFSIPNRDAARTKGSW